MQKDRSHYECMETVRLKRILHSALDLHDRSSDNVSYDDVEVEIKEVSAVLEDRGIRCF